MMSAACVICLAFLTSPLIVTSPFFTSTLVPVMPSTSSFVLILLRISASATILLAASPTDLAAASAFSLALVAPMVSGLMVMLLTTCLTPSVSRAICAALAFSFSVGTTPLKVTTLLVVSTAILMALVSVSAASWALTLVLIPASSRVCDVQPKQINAATASKEVRIGFIFYS